MKIKYCTKKQLRVRKEFQPLLSILPICPCQIFSDFSVKERESCGVRHEVGGRLSVRLKLNMVFFWAVNAKTPRQEDRDGRGGGEDYSISVRCLLTTDACMRRQMRTTRIKHISSATRSRKPRRKASKILTLCLLHIGEAEEDCTYLRQEKTNKLRNLGSSLHRRFSILCTETRNHG